MAFDPKKHLITIRGRDGERLYMPVSGRVLAFRDVHPDGQVVTHVLSHEPILVRAEVWVGDRLLATGHGSVPRVERAVWTGREYEKAETAAVGRALAFAGFGTEYEPQADADDLAYLADTPVPAAAPPAPIAVVPQPPRPADTRAGQSPPAAAAASPGSSISAADAQAAPPKQQRTYASSRYAEPPRYKDVITKRSPYHRQPNRIVPDALVAALRQQPGHTEALLDAFCVGQDPLSLQTWEALQYSSPETVIADYQQWIAEHRPPA